MAGIGVTSRREIEQIAEALEDRPRLEKPRSCGRQLQCQREPVEALTQCAHVVARPDRGVDALCALHEERHRLLEHERREVEPCLRRHVERLAARDDEPDGRRFLDQGREVHGDGRQELLDVVDHEVRAAVVDPGCDADQGRLLGAQCVRNRLQHERRVVERREWDEHRAAVGLLREEPAELERESGLAGASRSRERNQPHPLSQQHLPNRCQFPLSSHERGEGRRHSPTEDPSFRRGKSGRGSRAKRALRLPFMRLLHNSGEADEGLALPFGHLERLGQQLGYLL